MLKISFIIISGGQRPAAIRLLLDSIRAQKSLDAEIIIVGATGGADAGGAKVLERPELAAGAAICEMRNLGAAEATERVVVLMDDDVELLQGWGEAVAAKIGGDWDIAGCRVVGPSGDRWYDWCWASRTDPDCPPQPLDYGETNEGLYISGCLMIVRKKVFEKVKFDENRVNHQRDDVDFCHRAYDAGLRFACIPDATAKHHMEPAGRSAADPSYGPDDFADGVHLFRKKEYERALEVFGRMPESVEAAYHGALCLKELGRLHEAASALEETVSRSEGAEGRMRRIYYSALFHLGSVEERRGARGRAADCYKKALEGFPEHREARAGYERVSSGR